MAQAQPKIEILLTVKDDGSTKKIALAGASVKELGVAGLHAEKGLSAAKRGVQSISQSLDQMKSLAVGALAVNQVSQYAASFITVADSMRNMDQRLLLVSKNTADYTAAQQSVTEIARASHTSLSDVNTLYSRMALATANLNVSQKDLADVTKTVALTVALSGSSASEASAGMQQFAQAMGSSRLGGDELRSVLENMPMLTKVFVDAAGGSMAALREMAEKGQLTTEWMIAAIKKGQAEIEKQAAGMPKTVAMAMTDLRNEAAKYIDEVNRSTGFTATLASAVSLLGRNLDVVATGSVAVLAAGITYLTATSLASLAAMVSTRVIPALIAMGTTTTTTTAAIVGVRSAITATSFSMGTMVAGLGALLSPIGMVTAAVGLGAIAWKMWGSEGEDAIEKAKEELAQMTRMNQLMKEQSDPQLKLDNITAKINAAKGKIEELNDKIRVEPLGDEIYAGQLNKAYALLGTLEDGYKATQENMELAAMSRGAKEIAVGMSVADYTKKMLAEQVEAVADAEDKKLIKLKESRSAAEVLARKTFAAKTDSPEEQAQAAKNTETALASVKARYDAEEAYIKETSAASKAAAKEAVKDGKDVLKIQKEIDDYRQSQAYRQVDLTNSVIAAEDKLRVAVMSDSEQRIDAINLEYAAKEKLLDLMVREGSTYADTQEEIAAIQADLNARKQEDLDDLKAKGKDTADELEKAFTGWANNMASGLNDVLWGADVTFGGIAESFAKMITQMTIQTQIIAPMLDSLFKKTEGGGSGIWGTITSLAGNLLGGAMGGAATGTTSVADAFNNTSSAWDPSRFTLGSAKGNVFNSPGLSAFSGSVVSRPTLFPFARGIGLMGEAGPEAILPLKRGSDGKLGISGSGGSNVVINITNTANNTQATATQRNGTGGATIIDVLIEQVKGAIAGDIVRGSGAIPNAMAGTYGLNRIAGAY